MGSKTHTEADHEHDANMRAPGQLAQNLNQNPELSPPEMIPAREPGTRQKILRAAATLPFITVCGLAFGFTAGVLCLSLLLPNAPSTRDYIFFWATGQQLAHHANPYDPVAVTRI